MKLKVVILILCLVNVAMGQWGDAANSEKGKYNNKSLFLKSIVDVDTTIDIKYYKLKVKVNFNPNNIEGVTQIDLVPTKTINTFFLNLTSGINVDSVKADLFDVTFVRTSDKVILNLPQSINQTQRISILIYYKGLPLSSGFGSFVYSQQSGKQIAWSLSEPYGAADWFPCKNSPDDKADSSEVWITCRSDYKGVSNGLMFESTNNADTTTTYKWKNKYSIAQYLISVAVTDYYLYSQYFKYSVSDSMPVTHYIYPESFNSIKPQLDKTIDMLHIFSDKFGLYPFINSKYGHAQINVSGGMEHQTCTSIGLFTENVIAHELAHQWWGDKITCRDWHHIWLNEGFATYSEGIYLEQVEGKESYDSFIRLLMFNAKKAVGTIYCQDIENPENIFDKNRTYAKGGVVLHMLRGVLGDSVFARCLMEYSKDTSVAYKTAVTEDFKRVCERVSGISLDYFFSEWIYGAGYPKYILNWSYEQGSGNGYNVKLNVKQSSGIFKMPVDITIKTGNGEQMFRVFSDSAEQNYIFSVNGKPMNLVFDPENKILKDKTGDETYPGITFRLGQNYPNPFNGVTVIEYEILKYGLVNISVYDILGRNVKEIINTVLTPGSYRASFEGAGISSGVYFYRMTVHPGGSSTEGFEDVKKMVIMR